MMRVFIAIDIPSDLREILYNLQMRLKKLDLRASFPHKKNYEITLVFLGEKNEGEIIRIKENLSKISSIDLHVHLIGLGSFPGTTRINNVWVGVDSLELSRFVTSMCNLIWFIPDKPFNPHLTLCRIKSQKNIGDVKKFISKNKNLDIGSFKVDKIFLKESKLTATGPIYMNLKEIVLN